MNKKASIFWCEENIGKHQIICEECGLKYHEKNKVCPNCSNPTEKEEVEELNQNKEKEEEDW